MENEQSPQQQTGTGKTFEQYEASRLSELMPASETPADPPAGEPNSQQQPDSDDARTADSSSEGQQSGDGKPEERSAGKKRESGYARNKRKLDAATRENAELKERIARLEQGQGASNTDGAGKPSTSQEAKLERPKRPKADDFDDDAQYEAAEDEYFEKLADYKAQKAINDRETKAAKSKAKDAAQAKRNDILSSHTERVNQLNADDYTEVVDGLGDIEMNDVVAFEILGSEHSATMLYHYGQHVDEFEQLAELSLTNPAKALKQVGAMESRISSRNGSKRGKSSFEPPPEPMSQTPSGSDEAGGNLYKQKSFADYEKLRLAQARKDGHL